MITAYSNAITHTRPTPSQFYGECSMRDIYSCDICYIVLASKKGLVTHHKIRHTNMGHVAATKCPKCGLFFTGKRGVAGHMSKHAKKEADEHSRKSRGILPNVVQRHVADNSLETRSPIK